MLEPRGPVAFQGERGAYSEAAARAAFGPETKVLPRPDLGSVFRAVEEGEAAAAVVPVENSFAGSVRGTYDLLLEREPRPVAEVVIPVRHALLALPGVEAGDLERALSHPQALDQCRVTLARLGLDPVAVYDTAGAAKRVREEGLGDAAAVASPLAGELYELEALERDVQDHAGNRTRFLVVATTWEAPADAGPHRTSLVLSTSHEPGALHEALGPFAEHDVNLLKLESRPTREAPWEYRFHLDLEGDPGEANVAAALDEVNRIVPYLEVLGVYPRLGSEPDDQGP